jgi:hypothetical protein
MREAKKELEILQISALAAEDINTLYFIKGRANEMAYLAHMEAVLDATEQQAALETQEDEDDAVVSI